MFHAMMPDMLREEEFTCNDGQCIPIQVFVERAHR